MYTHKLKGLAAIALLAGGCSYDPGAGGGPESEGSLQIVVAPWEVDSEANFACYKIAVTNSAGASVWSADSVCTDKFSLGQNGTLSYVGICDASGSGRNTAKISLVRLVADDGTDLSNWGAKPPTFVGDFTCLANADTVVRASFLVISQGEKGFLDVQVSVQEIDCNAKIDCQSNFLDNNPADCASGDAGCPADTHGVDGSIVVALACNATGANFARLMLDEIVLTCMDSSAKPVTVSVDPSYGTGVLATFPRDFVFGAIGNAGVSLDGTSYWTVAIGISKGYTDCHLSTRMAASDGRSMTVNDQFPIIVATDIPFGFDAAGAFSCAVNPLDGDTSGLTTGWGSGADLAFQACLHPDGSVGLCQ